jgi:hypothetical protein
MRFQLGRPYGRPHGLSSAATIWEVIEHSIDDCALDGIFEGTASFLCVCKDIRPAAVTRYSGTATIVTGEDDKTASTHRRVYHEGENSAGLLPSDIVWTSEQDMHPVYTLIYKCSNIPAGNESKARTGQVSHEERVVISFTPVPKVGNVDTRSVHTRSVDTIPTIPIVPTRLKYSISVGGLTTKGFSANAFLADFVETLKNHPLSKAGLQKAQRTWYMLYPSGWEKIASLLYPST